MLQTRILNYNETVELLKMHKVIEVVENAYRIKAEGNAKVFPLIFHEFQRGKADMDIKSGWLKSSEIFGLKLVSWFEDNTKKNLPALLGAVMVFDANTGALLGLMNGAYITGIRTGAAGAIGAKCLARPDSESLLLVGAGHVAAFQIAAMLYLFPGLKKVMIYDALSYPAALEMAETIAKKIKQNFEIEVNSGIEFVAVKNIKEATEESDIIITVTPARTPIIKKDWVRVGTHFSCIGADMAGKEEIDPEIFRCARVFVDDLEQCINVGEIEIPVSTGILKREDVAGEIGDILTGKVVGRQNINQITVFDATGTALLDLITAKLALNEADKRQIGTFIDLFA